MIDPELTSCPQCGSNIKIVPAGVSRKTGKPYDAFQACSQRNCGWKPLRKPEGIPSAQGAKLYNTNAGEIMDALRKLYALTKTIEGKVSDIGLQLEELKAVKDNLDPDAITFS